LPVVTGLEEDVSEGLVRKLKREKANPEEPDAYGTRTKKVANKQGKTAQGTTQELAAIEDLPAICQIAAYTARLVLVGFRSGGSVFLRLSQDRTAHF
jgi:hypothetical protein